MEIRHNQLIKTTNAINAEHQYKYNDRNLLIESIDPEKRKTTYQYDDLGRITSKQDELGTINYTYDANSNITIVEENRAQIKRTYDALNRVTSYTDAYGRIIKYGYDEIGNLVTLSYPGGKTIRYTYNPDGQLESAIDGNHKTIYNYDNNGRLTQIRRPDGSIEHRTYDNAGRVISQKDVAADGTVLAAFKYNYDAYGNILKTIDQTGSFRIDPNALPSGSTMEYNDANQLIRYNGKSVSYDQNGNMTYGPLNGVMTAFRYDCRNRLIQAGNTTYTYDAENNRIASTTNNIKTEYVVNTLPELSQVLEEYTGGSLSRSYTYGNGQLLSDDQYYYHYDNIGSTRALTNTSGKLVQTYAYDIYGKLLSGDTTLTGYRYNGAYGVHTDKNGLYYMRARYYNVDICRFINPDILTGSPMESQSLNRYAYCQGNPVNQLDPFGLNV